MAGNDWMPQGATEVTSSSPASGSAGAWMPQEATEVQTKPSAMDYWIKNPAKSAVSDYASNLKDIGTAITHPVDTAMAMGNALTHPIYTIKQTVKDLPNTIMHRPIDTALMLAPGAEGVAGLAEKGIAGAKTAMTDIGNKNLENRINSLYNASVGTKLKNAGDANKFSNSRVNLVKTISDNLPNTKITDSKTGELVSKTPENRLENLRALIATKKVVWDKVSGLSKGATDAGATIDMTPIVKKAYEDTVNGIGEDALKANPRLLNSIQNEARNVLKIDTTTPSRAEQYMKSLNDELKSFRNSGQAVDYSVVDFKNNLIRHLNDATDSTIENTLSKSGYGEARDQYAALKSGEKEMLQAANKYLREQGGQGGGIAHPISNIWALENVLEAGGKVMTGRPHEAVMDLLRAGTIKAAAKLSDYFKSPDQKISKMYDLAKKYQSPASKVQSEPSVNPGSNYNEFFKHGENMATMGLPAPARRDLRPSRGLPSPNVSGQSSGPTIRQPGYVPPGLPEPFQGRSGVDRPWENKGLPSPRKVGQSSGPVIKQGTSYKPPEGPKKWPKTDFGHQIKNQMMNDESVPLHPAKDARARLNELYPTAVKGNPNISMHDLEDFNAMKDWELSQNPGGWKSHGPQQDLTFTKSNTGHSEAFQKVSGNSQKVGFDLLKRASNGDKMTTGEKLKIKMLIQDFRKNIKPKM